MPAYKNVADVRRFLGMANELGRFTPHLATLSQPLCHLVWTDRDWCWNVALQQAFDHIKTVLSSHPTLALYNPNHETCLSTDASLCGLGAVLHQKQPTGEWRSVAYQSRSLSETEQCYSQIKIEALAIIWACECFSRFLLGSTFIIETDRKPLVRLLNTKKLDDLSPRVLCFRLHLMCFTFNIRHVPGKNLITADTLSRAPASCAHFEDKTLRSEVTAFHCSGHGQSSSNRPPSVSDPEPPSRR